MYRFIPPLVVLTPHDSNAAVYMFTGHGFDPPSNSSWGVPLSRIENEEPVLVSII